jgi:hypothetical protein
MKLKKIFGITALIATSFLMNASVFANDNTKIGFSKVEGVPEAVVPEKIHEPVEKMGFNEGDPVGYTDEDKNGMVFFLNSSITDGNSDGFAAGLEEKIKQKDGLRNIEYFNNPTSIYGLDYYATVTKQSYDLIDNNNSVILNNIIKNNPNMKVGEVNAIVGIDYSHRSLGSFSNASGYDTSLSSVYLGAQKQFTSGIRGGALLNITNGDTDYKNDNGSRDDLNYQGTFFVDVITKEDVHIASMLYIGKIDSSLKRNYASSWKKDGLLGGSGYESGTNKAEMDTTYFGLNNNISKRYDIDKFKTKFYYEPRFNFDFTYLMQGDIEESAGGKLDNNLHLDSDSGYSLTSSIGIALGKDFYLKNNSKLNVELAVDIFAEMGSKYFDLENNKPFGTSIGDIYKGDISTIRYYDEDEITTELSLLARYEAMENFNIYGIVSYNFGDNEDEIRGDLGLSYKF